MWRFRERAGEWGGPILCVWARLYLAPLAGGVRSIQQECSPGGGSIEDELADSSGRIEGRRGSRENPCEGQIVKEIHRVGQGMPSGSASQAARRGPRRRVRGNLPATGSAGRIAQPKRKLGVTIQGLQPARARPER